MQRGELRRDVHYFQQQRRGRLIFKWAAIVALIEHDNETSADANVADAVPNGADEDAQVIAVAEATEKLRRLFG